MGTADEGTGVGAGGAEEQATYTCPECPEKFDQPEQLGAHLERHRAADSNPSTGNPCPKDCGRVFKFHERKELKDHAKNCDGSPPLPVAAAPAAERARPPALPPVLPLEDEQPLKYSDVEIRRQAEGFGRRKPETGEVPKEKVVAKLTCELCHGEKFERPQALGAHRRYKHAGARPSERAIAAAKRFSASREKRKDIERSDKTIDGAAGAIEKALVDLRAKRQALIDGIPELQDLNKAIAALEAIAGPPADPTPAE